MCVCGLVFCLLLWFCFSLFYLFIFFIGISVFYGTISILCVDKWAANKSFPSYICSRVPDWRILRLYEFISRDMDADAVHKKCLPGPKLAFDATSWCARLSWGLSSRIFMCISGLPCQSQGLLEKWRCRYIFSPDISSLCCCRCIRTRGPTAWQAPLQP